MLFVFSGTSWRVNSWSEPTGKLLFWLISCLFRWVAKWQSQLSLRIYLFSYLCWNKQGDILGEDCLCWNVIRSTDSFLWNMLKMRLWHCIFITLQFYTNMDKDWSLCVSKKHNVDCFHHWSSKKRSVCRFIIKFHPHLSSHRYKTEMYTTFKIIVIVIKIWTKIAQYIRLCMMWWEQEVFFFIKFAFSESKMM